VQADILTQLGHDRPAQVYPRIPSQQISQFEVVEVSIPGAGPASICRLLADPARRAGHCLCHFEKAILKACRRIGPPPLPAAAYHAGLNAETRDRVQRAFQAGRTRGWSSPPIAFGMGIDKANIRTGHFTAGLPSSLEGYYQEIGPRRARRCREPHVPDATPTATSARTASSSIAITRPVEHLNKVFAALRAEPLPVEEQPRPLRNSPRKSSTKRSRSWRSRRRARRFRRSGTKGASGWQKSYTDTSSVPRRTVSRMSSGSPIRACAGLSQNLCGISEM